MFRERAQTESEAILKILILAIVTAVVVALAKQFFKKAELE